MTRLLVLNMVTGEVHRYAPDPDNLPAYIYCGDGSDTVEMPCDPWLHSTWSAADGYRQYFEKQTGQPHAIVALLPHYYKLDKPK